MLLAGVLLTGGASRRMGTDKASIMVHGETLAARAARVLTAVCDPAIEVGTGVSGLPAIQEEPRYAGPLVALIAGRRALGDPAQILLLACDLPFVEPPLLQLLAEWPGAGSVIPAVDGRVQYACARYGSAALDAGVAALHAGDTSLRAIADVDAVYVTEAEWGAVATAQSFADVDTPDDLRRLGLEARE